ncbi:MAG: 23S rRNA (pseudouridine(1915)-N(3))-methyltransferase RlmH [Gammaproteobacteria bacterium]|nr:23S rRNA (pseudouridine(1915)-N(3))-methyltransferase RlmH [Gammaproteobacteria bacterium]
MKIKIIAVGKNMPQWIMEGFNEYHKRLPAGLVNLHELAPAKLSSLHTPEKIKEDEGARLLKLISPKDFVIALEVKGISFTTEELSLQINQWQLEGLEICLLIGGAEGLSKTCLQRAQKQWSLSALTLPHPLVRVVLIEQLYRAWSILQQHPYHRA